MSQAKILHTFPESEKAVSMVQFNGKLLVLTEYNLYWLRDDLTLEAVPIIAGEQNEP